MKFSNRFLRSVVVFVITLLLCHCAMREGEAISWSSKQGWQDYKTGDVGDYNHRLN